MMILYIANEKPNSINNVTDNPILAGNNILFSVIKLNAANKNTENINSIREAS